jgi:hypothetical protein
MRTLRALLALAFVGFAALQWNDPDPLRWMALYGAAALASGLGAAGKPQPWLDGLLGPGALAWAASLAPALGRIRGQDFFGQIGMVNLDAEEAREAAGLAIVAAALLPFAVRATVARLRR